MGSRARGAGVARAEGDEEEEASDVDESDVLNIGTGLDGLDELSEEVDEF